MFRLPKDQEMTLAILDEFIAKHRQQVTNRYQKLHDAYCSDHDILKQDKKPAYKPDNRIVVNFAKYITDTFNGFFIGIPVKVSSDDEAVSDFVEYIDRYNDQDDNNAELSKIMSIFGKAYEMYYTDEEAELCITYLSPLEAFMVFDDSILARPMYFVRTYKDWKDVEYGSISNSGYVRHFQITGGIKWLDEWQPHYFDGVPATEYVENEERLGIFEGSVLSMMNAYEKVLSEKANDVDYFADAYLKVLGPRVDASDVAFIRDNRIVNFEGDAEAGKIVVEFMGKPESDTAQENLLNRLEQLIFQISMVANISDENFGTSSGIALKYKLQAMSNLFKAKERKFVSGMNRRYKLLFSHPVSKVAKDAWIGLNIKCTPNFPANLLDEVEIAAKMEGITSHETQLSVLSIVENVQDELDRIEEENKQPERPPVESTIFGNPIPEIAEDDEEVMEDEQ